MSAVASLSTVSLCVTVVHRGGSTIRTSSRYHPPRRSLSQTTRSIRLRTSKQPKSTRFSTLSSSLILTTKSRNKRVLLRFSTHRRRYGTKQKLIHLVSLFFKFLLLLLACRVPIGFLIHQVLLRHLFLMVPANLHTKRCLFSSQATRMIHLTKTLVAYYSDGRRYTEASCVS